MLRRGRLLMLAFSAEDKLCDVYPAPGWSRVGPFLNGVVRSSLTVRGGGRASLSPPVVAGLHGRTASVHMSTVFDGLRHPVASNRACR